MHFMNPSLLAVALGFGSCGGFYDNGLLELARRLEDIPVERPFRGLDGVIGVAHCISSQLSCIAPIKIHPDS